MGARWPLKRAPVAGLSRGTGPPAVPARCQLPRVQDDSAGSRGSDRRPASVEPGAHRFHPHERPICSTRDRAWGLPARCLGLYFEQGYAGVRRLRGPGGLVGQGHADRGLARRVPMPRDRPRRVPDPAGSLGAVHLRPSAAEPLRPGLRTRLAGAPRVWRAGAAQGSHPPQNANRYWTIGVWPSSFPPPDLPQLIRFAHPPGTPPTRAPLRPAGADVASPLMETPKWF